MSTSILGTWNVNLCSRVWDIGRIWGFRQSLPAIFSSIKGPPGCLSIYLKQGDCITLGPDGKPTRETPFLNRGKNKKRIFDWKTSRGSLRKASPTPNSQPKFWQTNRPQKLNQSGQLLRALGPRNLGLGVTVWFNFLRWTRFLPAIF